MGSVKTFGWLCSHPGLAPARPRFAVTDADRVAVYKEFRTQFDAKQYAAAQPLAERLVQLTEEQYGAEELQLTNPLTNLATVHYKLGNYPGRHRELPAHAAHPAGEVDASPTSSRSGRCTASASLHGRQRIPNPRSWR